MLGKFTLISVYRAADIHKQATGFIAVDERSSTIIVSFRGTIDTGDILREGWEFWSNSNVDYFSKCGQSCKVAVQLQHQWNPIRADVFQQLNRLLNTYKGFHIKFTGHSLGGATATLAAIDYRANYPYSPKPRAYLVHLISRDSH
jgi:hypothetical protein